MKDDGAIGRICDGDRIAVKVDAAAMVAELGNGDEVEGEFLEDVSLACG